VAAVPPPRVHAYATTTAKELRTLSIALPFHSSMAPAKIPCWRDVPFSRRR